GRDVESIIRDLTEIAIKMTREEETAKVRVRAEDAAEERVLDALLPRARTAMQDEPAESADEGTQTKYRKMLGEGRLDERVIAIEVRAAPIGVESMAPPGMEEMTSQLQSMFQGMGNERTKTHKLPISEALKLLRDEEAAKLVNE